jgi:hypothetical protein
LQSHHLSKTKAQRSSSETLVKRSAPITNRNGKLINDQPLFPNLLSDLLANGHAVKFRAPGDSMYPTICDGDVITVVPIESDAITIGDIILYGHTSGVVAHRVMRIIERSEARSRSALEDSQNRSASETLRFILRGDAAIVFDDPVSADQVLGKVTLVERQGRRIDPYALKATICFHARRLAARLKRHLCFQS